MKNIKTSFIKEQDELHVTLGQIGLSWTGQAGFAMKDSDQVIYHIDPYLSNACSRYVGYHRILRPPVEAMDVKTDFILFTHEHRDHLDPDSIPVISRRNPSAKFICPSGCSNILLEMGISSERVITINRDECINIGNINLKAVKACHTADSVGYLIDINGIRIYHTGDTLYSDDLIAITEMKPDLMMICINGRLGCMNIEDAARLTSHIQPKVVIPMHFGMFKENTADPKEFVKLAQANGGVSQGYIMEYGRWYLYDKNHGFNNSI